MGEYQTLIETLALTLGVAWASGINLYAAVTVLGLAGLTGYADLPPGLEVVQDPLVLTAAAFMYCVEFLADKTPGVDSAWDALHTFVRIPAGAMLAAGAVGGVDPALSIAAGLLGGTLTAASHATKAGTRVLINTSPEPFTNIGASLAEDVVVFAGLWAALQHPVLFLLALVVFVVAVVWLLPRLVRGIKAVFLRIGRWLGLSSPRAPYPPAGAAVQKAQEHLAEVQRLVDAGVLDSSALITANARLSQSQT